MAMMWRSFLLLGLTAVVSCTEEADKVVAAVDDKAGKVKSVEAWGIFGSDSTPAATTAAKTQPQAPSAMVSAPETPDMTDAVELLKTDMWSLLNIEHYQWAIAIFFLAFGAVALYDGVQFFKNLVIIAVSAIFFCLVLSQLEPSWVEPGANVAKYVASLEFGLFMGLVAYQGWKGTQLLLGLTLGMYLFQTAQGFASMNPQVEIASKSAACIVGVYTFMVLLGAWAVHEKWGAGRLLGIIAPLVGSGMFVAAIGYFVLLACTDPAVGKDAHIKVAESDVPSVFKFWCMIVYPMHSQSVGIFESAGKFLFLGDYKLSFDRVLGVFFEIVFFILGMRFQLKGRKNKQLVKAIDQFCETSDHLKALSFQLRSEEASSLDRRLLSNDGTIKIV